MMPDFLQMAVTTIILSALVLGLLGCVSNKANDDYYQAQMRVADALWKASPTAGELGEP